MKLRIYCLEDGNSIVANGTGIYALVAFTVPSVLVKDM